MVETHSHDNISPSLLNNFPQEQQFQNARRSTVIALPAVESTDSDLGMDTSSSPRVAGRSTSSAKSAGLERVNQVLSQAHQAHVDELRVYLTEMNKVLRPRGIPRWGGSSRFAQYGIGRYVEGSVVDSPRDKFVDWVGSSSS